MRSTYETIGGKYQQNGDYLLPNLEVPESPKIGAWGERRRKYLREHQKALYTAMMLSDTLNVHLDEVDRTATEMYDHLCHPKRMTRSRCYACSSPKEYHKLFQTLLNKSN